MPEKVPNAIDSDTDRLAGLALIREFLDVSRETEARLEVFAEDLKRWSKAKNLVGPQTLSKLWTRHIADSAQVLACAPQARRWVDLGSGAGFPGLAVAILVSGRVASQTAGEFTAAPIADIRLVESNGRKCAFLRDAARRTQAPVTVHCQRIEDFVAGWTEPVDVVTARALAPLSKLLDLASPLIEAGAVGVFHKGQDVERELNDAATCWTFSREIVPSRMYGDGALVIIRDCKRKSD